MRVRILAVIPGIAAVAIGLLCTTSVSEITFPMPSSTAPPTATPLPTLIPRIVFSFGEEVPEAEREQIRQAMAIGYDCLMRWDGEYAPAHVYAYTSLAEIEAALSEHTGTPSVWGDAAGRASRGGIFLLASGWWTTADFGSRAETVMHELYHVQHIAWAVYSWAASPDAIPNTGPRWIEEGAADLFAEHCTGEAGLRPYDWVFNHALTEAASEPLALQDMSTNQQWDSQGSYSTAFLAANYLLARSGGNWEVYELYFGEIFLGAPWPDAFEKAFGLSIDEFYTQFYASGMLPPGD